MRRLAIVLALLGLVAIAVPVIALEHEFDRHPHMLLQRPEVGLIEGVPHLLGFRKCVDLAGNNTVPLHAHHERLHFGDSGVSFDGKSGHVVIPGAPFPSPLFESVPWSNCDEFATFLPLDISD